MGLYKEVDYWFREKDDWQERIYDDSCDMGVPVSGFGDGLMTDLREIFDDRGRWKGFLGSIKKHREEERYADGTLMSSKVTVYLPWESEAGLFRCTKWEVCYHRDPKRKKEYVSFDSSSAVVGEDKLSD